MITIQLSALPDAIALNLDDHQLVKEAQKDLTAFSELYQRYVNQVYRYLLVRTGNRDDAQDLTSQTFLAAMQSLHTYREGRPFVAWLLGIARNKNVDQYRRRQPSVDLEMAEVFADEQPELDTLVYQRLEIEQIARKLQSIAPERAEALSLRLFGELEVKEIAHIMNRNEAAVRMLVFRGFKDLQNQLQLSREDKDE